MTGLRRRFLRTGGTALLAASLLALAGPPTAAHASERYRETIEVSADGGSVATQATLLPDIPYTLAVEGTYGFGGGSADAECSRSLDPVWHRDREGLDLLVDGLDVDWQAVESDLLGCDSQHHRYMLSLSVQTERQLVFRIEVPTRDQGSGVLSVVLEGSAVAEPLSSDAADEPDAAVTASAPANQEPETGPEPEPARASAPARQRAPATSDQSGDVGRTDPAAPAASERDRSEPTAADDTRRDLTTEELLDLFAPGVTQSDRGSTPEDNRIELTASPSAPVSTPATPTSPTLVTWLALFLLIGVAIQLLVSTHSRGRLVQVLGAEASVVLELLTGNNAGRAVAHRAAVPTTDHARARPPRAATRRQLR